MGENFGLDIPGNGEVLGEGFGCEGEDIGSIDGEALIVQHVFPGTTVEYSALIGHRACGVADVIVGTSGCRRCVDGESFVGVEIEACVGGGFGGPFVVASPVFGTAIEDGGFWFGKFSVVAEIGIEEGKFDIVFVVGARVATPVVDTEFLSGFAGPHSVIPRAHDEPVVGLLAGYFGGFVAGEGAVAVFGVKESADPEHCGFDVFELTRNGSGLPEIVVSVVADGVLPKGDRAFVEFFFDICDAA